MRLEHVMQRDPLLVSPKTSIVDCARMMRERSVSSVLVTEGDGRLCGILTERDLSHKVVAEGLACEGLFVGDFMTPEPVSATPDAPVWEGARLLAAGGMRHLPIVSDGVPVGTVSVRNLVGVDLEPQQVQHVIAGLHASSRERTVEIPVGVGAGDPGDFLPAWY